MRHSFPGYYPPSEAEMASLWRNGTVVLDASVLLNLYRYAETTSNELMGVLRPIQERLWLPHQAAMEFHQNRLQVISKTEEAYAAIKECLDKTNRQLGGALGEFARHPLVDVSNMASRVEALFAEFSKELDEARQRHPSRSERDRFLEEVTELFEGRVGEEYDENRIKELHSEGAARFAKMVPPGYLDAKKGEEERFGDFILWKQTIEYAKQMNKSVLLVIDDDKDDWWWRFKGKTVGPRPELVKEMQSDAGVMFYMYRSHQFMEQAGRHWKRHVKPEAIAEVKSVGERSQRAREEEALLVEMFQMKQHQLANRDMLRELESRIAELEGEGVSGGAAAELPSGIELAGEDEQRLRRGALRRLRRKRRELLEREAAYQELLRYLRNRIGSAGETGGPGGGDAP